MDIVAVSDGKYCKLARSLMDGSIGHSISHTAVADGRKRLNSDSRGWVIFECAPEQTCPTIQRL